jgi:hypothetical protein
MKKVTLEIYEKEGKLPGRPKLQREAGYKQNHARIVLKELRGANIISNKNSYSCRPPISQGVRRLDLTREACLTGEQRKKKKKKPP